MARHKCCKWIAQGASRHMPICCFPIVGKLYPNWTWAPRRPSIPLKTTTEGTKVAKLRVSATKAKQHRAEIPISRQLVHIPSIPAT